MRNIFAWFFKTFAGSTRRSVPYIVFVALALECHFVIVIAPVGIGMRYLFARLVKAGVENTLGSVPDIVFFTFASESCSTFRNTPPGIGMRNIAAFLSARALYAFVLLPEITFFASCAAEFRLRFAVIVDFNVKKRWTLSSSYAA